MAAKKQVSTETRSGGALSMKEALAARAAALMKRVSAGGGGNKIKIADKVFTFPDGTVDPGPIEVVIVGVGSQNRYYTEAWKPNKKVPPICWAAGLEVDDLVPSDLSPEVQSDSCETCPMNQFGSDDEGKACKNIRVLAVIAPDATSEDDIMFLEVPPTSLSKAKGIDTYINTLIVAGKHPMEVITEVAFDPNSTYPKMRFSMVGVNEDPDVAFAKLDDAEAQLKKVPDFRSNEVEEEEPKPKPKTRGRRKAAPAAKTTRTRKRSA